MKCWYFCGIVFITFNNSSYTRSRMSLDVRDILDMPSATGERASKKKKVEPVKRPAGKLLSS